MECEKCKSTNIIVLEELKGLRYDMYYNDYVETVDLHIKCNDCKHEFYENIE